MRFKVILLLGVGAAGFGASYALAGTHGHHPQRFSITSTTSCTRRQIVGTVAAPQSFTVTLTRAAAGNSFGSGQVVTVQVGTSGTLRLLAAGCASGATLTARSASLSAMVSPPARTTTTGTTTTTRRRPPGHHHNRVYPQTTTTTTTTS